MANFQRMFFANSFIHEVQNGASRVTYLAGHFYHVAEEHVAELIEKAGAEIESVREERLKLEAEAKAAEEAIKAEAAKAEAAKQHNPNVESSTGADTSAVEDSAAEQHETAPSTPER